MQYQQGNLNAEFIDDQTKYIQQPGVYGVPLQGQPIVGQPVQPQYYQMQYGQPYQQAQYGQGFVQYPQRIQNVNQGYQQQVLLIPSAVIVAQPLNPVVAKDLALRQYARYFYGCNCCFGILALIFLIVRCVASFNQGGADVAAGILYILSDFFFVVGVIFGLYSISRYVERLLLHYQVYVGIALTFELIASIIIFASYGEKSEDNSDEDEDDYHSKYSKDQQDSQNTLSLIFFIVSLVILIICYGMFIRYARHIRFLMIDLNQARLNSVQSNAQIQQQQQNPLQNQGLFIG